jgi:hypothetical protein
MVSTRSKRLTPVERPSPVETQEELTPQPASAPVNAVTPDHGADAAVQYSDGTDACNIPLPRLLEIRLKAVLDSSNIAVELAFNHWMSKAQFIALIETLGGPFTESYDNKVIAIDLSKALVRAMGFVSCAGQLTGGFNNENTIGNEKKNVYYCQSKIQGIRLYFFYLSSGSKVTENVRVPNAGAAKEIDSQEVQSYLKNDFSYLRNWWYSKKAELLFKPREDEESVFQGVQNMFSSLDKALKKGNDILMIVEGFVDSKRGCISKEALRDYDPIELNTFRQDITDRALYLRAALGVALKVDGLKQTLNWENCIAEAIKAMYSAGFTRFQKSTQPVQAWFRQFRDHGLNSKRRQFPNFLRVRKRGSLLLLKHPALKQKIATYINENLETLSASKLSEVLLKQLIPNYIEEEELCLPPLDDALTDELEDNEVQRFLLDCSIKKLSERTCLSIMHDLGASFDTHKKGFYNNTHEQQLEERVKYVWSYLFDIELKAPHFVKLPLSEVEKLKREEKLHADFQGQSFTRNGQEWRQFHVDCCKEFADMLLQTPLDDRYSVDLHPEESRYILMGQDESVVSQYEMTSRAWKGTDGRQSMRPKSKGKGIMMSGIVSRVFGWDPIVTVEQLAEINEQRKDKEYFDTEAALEINATAKKPALTFDGLPFLCFLEIGANSEGWWTGANMHLLVEDLADCMKVMYPGKTYILFTDWSQGHARKRPDALKASDMNKGFGGVQVRSHLSMITKKEFGDFGNPNMLERPERSDEVCQSFVFEEGNLGPCWMTEAERELNKYDREIQGKTAKKRMDIDELRGHLKAALDPDLPANFQTLSKTKLNALAKKSKVPNFTLVPKIQYGWMGQAKGLLQICYERGLIDGVTYKEKDLWKQYSKDGKKNAQGERIPGTNLVELLNECADFKNELTMLQFVGEQCGVRIIMSPKCHCEIAGECIEIIWGIGKVRFRRIPLEDRKTFENFKAHVKSTFSRDKIGSKELRGAFRTFRSYILAYYAIHKEQYANVSQEDATEEGGIAAASNPDLRPGNDSNLAGSDTAGTSFPSIDLELLNLPAESEVEAELVMASVSSVDLATIQKKMGEYKSHISAIEIFGKTIRDIANDTSSI